MLALLGAAVVLGACSSNAGAPSGTGSAGDRPVSGGTAYFAEQPQTPPNYIFPLISGAYFTVANTANFQTLLYEPLYWFGDKGSTGIDYRRSIGNAPVYSAHDTIVTITLKHYVWSDGEVVSARDVLFWLNLLRANEAGWASYVPGGFPDNVVSATAVNPTTVRLVLNRSYNPRWYTYNELSQITPLPLAWDRTSLTAPVPTASSAVLPDTTSSGAKAVYKFLNGEATKLASYATSPIWSVVDGPWRLQTFTSQGYAAFVPNPTYSGPSKPRLAKFVELPFTSSQAEFSLVKAGSSVGGASVSGEQVSVGYVPDNDLPQRGALASQGYRLVPGYPFQFDYFEPNFNNPVVGPIFRQLYFRQAFQHLVDQTGWIRAFYQGLGVPTYGPIPALPANPYADATASVNPYPFSVSDARQLLASHGWRVAPNGTTRCVSPGAGAGHCGTGVKADQPLQFNLLYPSGLPYTDNSMLDLQSVARKVGIQISLKQVPATTIAATILPCKASQAACSWQLGQYGAGWVFEPDHYPSGEEIFQTGALGNVNNYSDPVADKLIIASTEAPAATAQSTLDAYQNYLRLQLPDFWQPSPGTLYTVQSNLRGFVPNAYGFITPQDWYFTSGS